VKREGREAENQKSRREERKRRRGGEKKKSRREEEQRTGRAEEKRSREEKGGILTVIRHFRELTVYRKAFDAAMRIYEMTKNFPSEERFSLVDQVRRSSRSVCSNISEGWRKRRYKAVFLNKLTDAMQEASETQCWLEFSFACRYIKEDLFHTMDEEYEEIIAMLNGMERRVDKFCF